MAGDAFDAEAWAPDAWLPAGLAAPQGVEVLRLASAGYATATTDLPASTLYPPRLLGDVVLSQSAMDALGFGGRQALTAAEVELADADGWAADLWRYGTADGRAATVRVVPVVNPAASDFGTPLAGTRLAFRGLVRSVARAANMRARLMLGDAADRLGVPLQPTLFAGAGGLEGTADLAGQPKPVALGRCYNVPPVYLGLVDLGAGALATYATHWREVAGHDAVRVRGVPQTPAAGVPLVGQYRDLPALGVFQLGGAADGEVRADVRGDAVGGYVNTTATVLARLLQTLGPQLGEGDMEASAWALADFDLPGEVGYFAAATVTADAAAAALLQGCGGVLAGGRSGALRLFDPLAADAPQFDIPAAAILDCEPVELPAALRPLPARVEVEYGRNWSPLSGVAGSVDDTARQRLTSAAAPLAGASSASLYARLASHRSLRLPGLYWDAAAAQARADALRDWVQMGPRCIRVVTDRYLGQVELGHIGRVTYPAFGLDGGMLGTVMAWREELGGGRLEITLVETG